MNNIKSNPLHYYRVRKFDRMVEYNPAGTASVLHIALQLTWGGSPQFTPEEVVFLVTALDGFTPDFFSDLDTLPAQLANALSQGYRCEGRTMVNAAQKAFIERIANLNPIEAFSVYFSVQEFFGANGDNSLRPEPFFNVRDDHDATSTTERQP